MPGEREIESLYAAARAGDTAAFRFGVPPLWVAVEDADPPAAAAVLARIVPLFDLVAARAGGQLAVLAVGLVARGAPAGALAPVMSRALTRILPAAAAFPSAWRRTASPWNRVPDPDDGARAWDGTLARLTRARPWNRRAALPVAEAVALTDAWFALPSWAPAATDFLRLPGAGLDLPPRTDLAALATQLALPDLAALLPRPA